MSKKAKKSRIITLPRTLPRTFESHPPQTSKMGPPEDIWSLLKKKKIMAFRKIMASTAIEKIILG